MTILTLIYAADIKGNFINPETDKCWNIPEDREFFRKTIKDKNIICGRKTFESDYMALVGARNIVVLTTKHQIACVFPHSDYKIANYPNVHKIETKMAALEYAKYGFGLTYHEEIFCIGGKQTIKSLAPFASRLLITSIAEDEYSLSTKKNNLRAALWVPKHIGFDLKNVWEQKSEYWPKINYCKKIKKYWAQFNILRYPDIKF